MSDTIKNKTKQMDMLHGPMMKNILLFALPLAASGIFQLYLINISEPNRLALIY